MLLPELLLGAASRAPDRTAAVFPDRACTFAEIDRDARRYAAQLAASGIGAGSRVALIAESSAGALSAYWGVLYVGAEAVDVPAHAGAETILEVLEECRPAALAADGQSLARLEPVIRAWPKHLLRLDAAPDLAPQDPLAAGDPGRVAAVIYTSGSTGRPKGVMLSHQNLISNLLAAKERMPIPEDERLLMVVPLYFVHGRMQLLAHTLAAATVVYSRGMRFPSQVVGELRDHQITSLSGVPYHFQTLLERSALAKTLLPKLRTVLITGGAMSRGGLRRLAEALPGAAIHTAYGATEASPRITHLSPAERAQRPESVGRLLPGVRVEILCSDGAAVPQGALGEVAASGPNVMAGYVSGDHASSGRIDAQGRLRTGDLGRIDADGYLYLAGRISEKIKSAGERVFPGEIEAVLLRHPAVREVAVFGAPDDLLGERISALVVPKAAVDPQSLKSHCLRWLPFVRTPREIHLVERLPKTSSGKIDKKALLGALEDARISERAAPSATESGRAR
jgi:acyl-CoA synthetase (AMP-forming)/AMP-acid ligase II